MKKVLKLDADYRPIEIVCWQDAIGLWWADRAKIIDKYPDFELRSPSLTMACPAVIRLVDYVGFRRNAKYSSAGVYSRDHYTCMYCGCQPGMRGLNLDHVIPKSHGGTRCWENIVTSCLECNTFKANRTPEEAGMTLKKQPVKPVLESVSFQDGPEVWDEWLKGWI